MTYRTADRVISTNESYRAIAIRRGRRHPDEVTVVRSGPDTRQMRPIYPEGRRRRGGVVPRWSTSASWVRRTGWTWCWT